MDCCTPITIKDPRSGYGGTIQVPCGKCAFCLRRRQREWIFRIKKEYSVSESAIFITLTYNNESITYGSEKPTLVKRDLQLFFKRLRKKVKKVYPEKRVRYYSVGEYGGITGRPHYHAIIFNMHICDSQLVDSSWSLGHVQVGTVTDNSIAYVTKYLINQEHDFEGRQRPFANMSLKPGIGESYLKYKAHHRLNDLATVTLRGYRFSMPRYYRERMFSKDELEQIGFDNRLRAEFNYKRDYDRLLGAGYEDPDEEIFQRRIAENEQLIKLQDKNRKL